MKKVYLLAALLFIAATSVLAQSTLPPAIEIKADTAGYFSIPKAHWQILPDATGKLSLPAVQASAFESPGTTKYRIANHDINVYWFRYSLKNLVDHSVQVAIPAALSRVEVYTTDSLGRWTKKTTGAGVPFSERSDFKRYRQLVYTIHPGETVTFYEREMLNFKIDRFMSLAIGYKILKDTPTEVVNYYEDRLSEVSVIAFLCGLLVLAALVNVFFYLVSREKVYLWFALFGLCYALLAGNMPLFDVFLKEVPDLNRYNAILALTSGFFLWKFLAAFYGSAVLYPRWHRVTDYLSYSTLLSAMLMASLNTIAIPWLSGLVAILVLTFCVNAVLILSVSLFKGKQDRIFKLVTALPFLFIAVTYIVADTLRGTGMDRNPVTNFLYEYGPDITLLCFYWLVVLFLWKMIQRFQTLQKQVLQEALEKERIEREGEAERLQLIAAQKVELEHQVTERTAEVNQSIIHLKQTQTQLIQSEKMASLGELTAGIAHEIQNPLNFVNNFSEVSIELVEEMEIELTNGDKDEALAIAGDVKQNLEKIRHHGKRADGIVKGMLQHSRAGGTAKEPTNINSLVDEYLRLAYHGLRAKDKNFNAELVSNLAADLPLIDVVPQDVGRVFLNLFTNAFYAMQQKVKMQPADYKPLVQVTTATVDGSRVEITVRDNGIGIPEAIRNKIMQPFFTTKPTGEGTGLGLSLSYDIVVKVHGGSISVDSLEGEFTQFVISLPTKS